MSKTLLICFFFGVILLGCFYLVNNADANPEIYYNPSGYYMVNTTCADNLTGWIADYDNQHSINLIDGDGSNPQLTFYTRVRINSDGGGDAWFNDSNKQILLDYTPSGTTDYFMNFYADSKVNFSQLDVINNYTGATAYYMYHWVQDADTFIELTDCNFKSLGSDTLRHGSTSYAVLTTVNLTRCSFDTMYIQRTQGYIYNSDFLNRVSGAPILNYNILGGDDIRVWNCKYACQGIGTVTVRGFFSSGISTYFFFTLVFGVHYTFIDSYSADNFYDFSVPNGATAQLEYTTRVKTIDISDSSGIADVFVNISEYDKADDSLFATNNLITDANGFTADDHQVNFTYLVGGIGSTQKYFYHIITVEKEGFYPISINTTIARERNWTLVMIPLPSIDIEENLVNCTGSYNYTWNPSTWNYSMWLNYSGTGLSNPGVWNYNWQPIWAIKNTTGYTILKLLSNGTMAIAGELWQNTNSPPPDAVYCMNDSMWLYENGSLYLRGDFYEESGMFSMVYNILFSVGVLLSVVVYGIRKRLRGNKT